MRASGFWKFFAERDGLEVTFAMDFRDSGRWLPETDLLVTYVAGPFPTTGAENDAHHHGWRRAVAGSHCTAHPVARRPGPNEMVAPLGRW